MDLSAFYSQFRDETTENLRVLGDGLLALEKDPADRGQLDTVFRAAHTIKGGARMLGFADVAALAHIMEHILGAVREGRRPLTPELGSQLLRAGDAIMALANAAVEGHPAAVDIPAVRAALEAAESQADTLPNVAPGQASPAHSPAPPPAAAPPPGPAAAIIPPMPAAALAAPAGAPTQLHPNQGAAAATSGATRRQTVRVRVDRLDRLLNLAGELAVGRQLHWGQLQSLDNLDTLVGQQQQTVLALESELRQLRFSAREQERIQAHLDALVSLATRTSSMFQQQLTQLATLTRRNDLLVDDLEQEVMAARLVAVGAAFANLPRATRDLCQTTGKQVELILSGEETELDRKVLELIGDPLTHLLRNAIDHGIESPDERERLGKPRSGQVRIAAEASSGQIQLSISDDGRGMDPEKLRASAVRKGLATADSAALLSDQEALELVFMPGFSTAQLITDISGRGVGLDVVRTNIAELGGQVQIACEVGHGTTITLLLPLTLVTTRVLLIEIAHQTYALPASSSRGVLWIRPEMLRSLEGQAIIQHGEQSLALIQLARLLGLESQPLDGESRRPAVLIGTSQRPLALVVDRIIDEREVVVKPLSPLFERFRQYAGATQLGDGQLVLLLHAPGLIALARGAAPTRLAPQARQRWRLLYAEDSFTTRELVRGILSSAGYEVTAAVDGQDALEKLRIQRFDLLISDVEMPRLNGFQLTSSLRRDLQITDMPVIIMTSLATDEHRRLGLESGAQAYIVKGQFDQDNLIETIRQLLGA